MKPHNLDLLHDKLSTSKKSIESMLKQFKYNEQLSHSENMELLTSCLESILNIGELSDFSRFIGNEEHLPIEINNSALRYEHLISLINDWLHPKSQLIKQRTISTTSFRNSLFGVVLADQKTAIDQYFLTISASNKVKSFDLFQVFTNLLSPYYLYEYSHDSVCFFEKVSSIDSFMKVVETYLLSSQRVQKDCSDSHQFVHRCEIEQLIQFWESFNPQLTLLGSPRTILQNAAVQTRMREEGSAILPQTDKHEQLLALINSTLHSANILIENENEPYRLKSLSNILNVLKEEKISIVQSERKNCKSSQLLNESKNRFEKSKRKLSTHHNTTPSKVEATNREYVTEIYNHLCQKEGTLNISELQIFFYSLGLVQAHENHLIKNLLKKGFIDSSDDISYQEFKVILKQLAHQSNLLKNSTLKKYVSDHIDSGSYKRTNHTKGISDCPLLSKSHLRFNTCSHMRKVKDFRLFSQSTSQLDSDDS